MLNEVFTTAEVRPRYELEAVIIEDPARPETMVPETRLTLSISPTRAVFRVHGTSVTVDSLDYDGHSHVAAALSLAWLNSALDADPRAASTIMGAAEVVGRAVFEGGVGARQFLQAFQSVATLRAGGRETLYTRVSRDLGIQEASSTIYRAFAETLASIGRVNARIISVAVNLAAARALRSLRGGSLRVQVVPSEGMPGPPTPLEEVLSRALEYEVESHLIAVPAAEAGRFYVEFLQFRLPLTAIILPLTLLGSLRGGDSATIAVMHPAHMPAYSSIYILRQALPDVKVGLLDVRLPVEAARLEEAAESLLEAVESGRCASKGCRELSSLRRLAGRIQAQPPALAPPQHGLVALLDRLVSSLGSMLRGQAEAARLLVDAASRDMGWLGRLGAQNLAERLNPYSRALSILREARDAAKARGVPGEVVEAVEDVALVLENVVYAGGLGLDLLRRGLTAVYYQHVLFTNNFVRLLWRLRRHGVPRDLRLALIASYLDVYESDWWRVIDAVRNYFVFHSSPSRVARAIEAGVYSFPLLSLPASEGISVEELFRRGVYVYPGGKTGDERNRVYEQAMLCMEILPAVFPRENVKRVGTCRVVRERTLVLGDE